MADPILGSSVKDVRKSEIKNFPSLYDKSKAVTQEVTYSFFILLVPIATSEQFAGIPSV